MSIKLILLSIAAILNILIGILIIKKNFKNTGNINFGLMCISGGLWVFFMGLLHSLNNLDLLSNYILKLTVIFSAFTPLFFLLFTLNFPYQHKEQRKLRWLYLVPGILTILIILNYFQVESISFYNNSLVEQVNLFSYIIFAAYFFIYIICGFFVLIKKYVNESGVYKAQLKFLLLSTILTFAVTTFFSIILPLINKYFYDWFSPLFTLINFFIIGYFLFIKVNKSS